MAQTSQGERALARATSYDEWESQFFKARLGLTLWFGAVGNANFILADYLFYPGQFPVLLQIRLVVQVLVVGLLLVGGLWWLPPVPSPEPAWERCTSVMERSKILCEWE